MDYLVYEYGCLPPVRGREAAVEQMLRRHRLWNSLVEVERDLSLAVVGVAARRDLARSPWMRRATG